MQEIFVFYNKGHRLVSFMPRLIRARVAIGFENGLFSLYKLKQQPRNGDLL